MSAAGQMVAAMFGGLLVEVVRLYEARELAVAPAWLTSAPYWAATLLMVVAGGGLAFVYALSGAQLNAISALHVGATTPLILKGLTTRAAPGVRAE